MGRTAGGVRKGAPYIPVWLGLWLAGCVAVFAEPTSPDRLPAETRETGAASAGYPAATDTEAKKQALTLGFIMLGIIIVGGTILLALVVIWGNRTRRLARSPLPPIAERNELWFLKPKKGAKSLERAAEDQPGPPPEDPPVEPDPE